MNWKIIFYLSLFGLLMAILTVFWIPTKIEPWFWLIILLFSAFIIAKKCNNRFFLHGFLVALGNCLWITGLHVILIKTYIANHPEMAVMNANMPLADHPRLMMLITGPFIGAVTGLILGLFAFIASKIIKKRN